MGSQYQCILSLPNSANGSASLEAYRLNTEIIV
jgi:hypothetical protein